MILDKPRRAGVLLHLTSLPCKYGYGAMNNEAKNFIDLLAECKLSLWQMLPIHPTHGLPHPDFLSPYQCQSVHAGNPLLIPLQLLEKHGVELANRPQFRLPEEVKILTEYRYMCLKIAHCYACNNATTEVTGEQYAFKQFRRENASWLEDYALFRALKEQLKYRPWWEWEKPYRDRYPQVMTQFRQKYATQIEQQCYEQFLFFHQWHLLKNYANHRGVYLIGDLPFFVAEDSVEMWAYRDNFLLNQEGRAKYFAGTDPQEDYFKPGIGQCWEVPIYNWDYMASNGFQWWIQRFNTMSRLFDMVRLTHFRGYVRTWAIPSETANPTANPKEGFWLAARGEDMFARLQQEWQHPIPMIVDDIGVEKDRERDVYDLWHEKFSIVDQQNRILSKMFGIKVLQLGFTQGGLRNLHLPHHYTPTRVAYTGTHDSNTTVGWFSQLHDSKQFVLDYFNVQKQDDIVSILIRSVMQSSARFAIIPMQDILRLEGQYRMNTPGETEGCWQWQFQWSQVSKSMKTELSQLVEWYQR